MKPGIEPDSSGIPCRVLNPLSHSRNSSSWLSLMSVPLMANDVDDLSIGFGFVVYLIWRKFCSGLCPFLNQVVFVVEL